MTIYVTPAQIGDGKCYLCGASRSQRVRHSKTGMDEPPFTIQCVNVQWCMKRQEQKR